MGNEIHIFTYMCSNFLEILKYREWRDLNQCYILKLIDVFVLQSNSLV